MLAFVVARPFGLILRSFTCHDYPIVSQARGPLIGVLAGRDSQPDCFRDRLLTSISNPNTKKLWSGKGCNVRVQNLRLVAGEDRYILPLEDFGCP